MNSLIIVNLETTLASVTTSLADFDWRAYMPRYINVRFISAPPINLAIKHSVKTFIQSENRTAPTSGQIAATLKSPDKPQGSNPRSRVRKIKAPASPAVTKGRNKLVTFELHAPDATTVKLAADFTEWEKSPLKLVKAHGDIWRINVSLAPGRYGYRFLVDGEWCDDPKCSKRVSNPFGSTNAIVEVP